MIRFQNDNSPWERGCASSFNAPPKRSATTRYSSNLFLSNLIRFLLDRTKILLERGGLSFSRLKFRYTRLLHSSFRFGEKSTVREMWRVGERKSRYMERIARRQLPRGFANPVLRSTIERATETLKSDRDRDREKERSQPTPDH